MAYLKVLLLLAALVGIGVVNYRATRRKAQRLLDNFRSNRWAP